LPDTLHLSHISGIAQLRPQFHHIDAKSQLVKEKAARKSTTTEAAARLNEPRLVQQSARTAVDDEEINIAKTVAFLRSTSEEKWTKMKYHDDEVCLTV
jgi:DNA-directed RNA polymerase III subunit RPC5